MIRLSFCAMVYFYGQKGDGMLSVNDLRNGVIGQLEQYFPAIPAHSETPDEGSAKPYFYVRTISVVQEREAGQRYKRNLSFDIQYFAAAQADFNETSYGIGEVLFEMMEYLIINGNRVKAKDLHCEDAEGIFHFFLTLELSVVREGETGNPMQTLEQEGNIKNG